MQPGTYTIPPSVTGDYWKGLAGVAVSPAPSNTLASVKMDFRTAPEAATAALSLSSADGEITISSAADWVIVVEPVSPLTLTAGLWFWDIQFTDANGDPFTYLAGTFRVLQDTTR